MSTSVQFCHAAVTLILSIFHACCFPGDTMHLSPIKLKRLNLLGSRKERCILHSDYFVPPLKKHSCLCVSHFIFQLDVSQDEIASSSAKLRRRFVIDPTLTNSWKSSSSFSLSLSLPPFHQHRLKRRIWYVETGSRRISLKLHRCHDSLFNCSVVSCHGILY